MRDGKFRLGLLKVGQYKIKTYLVIVYPGQLIIMIMTKIH